MATLDGKPSRKDVWQIAERQHDRISLEQLLGVGMTYAAIRQRVKTGRLFRVAHSVFAISRPRGTDEERWMTAVLGCCEDSATSGASALRLLGLTEDDDEQTEVSVPIGCRRRPSGVIIRARCGVLPAERQVHRSIPVTSPALTIIDCARALGERGVERAINEASQRDLATPAVIRGTAERYPRVPGSPLVRAVLDRHDFQLTDSELERWFSRIVRLFGFPVPLARQRPYGYRVDFFWPDLGLIVECDSLRYHRTAGKQTRDLERDQVHTAAGLTTMRFTHWQIRYAPEVVAKRLTPVIERLAAAHAHAVGG